jgi:hypothetical protein
MNLLAALGRLGMPPSAPGMTYGVEGRVTDANGDPIPHATVVALDRSLRASKELGRAATDANGYYRITYPAASLLAGRTTADLQLEVRNTGNTPLLTSDVNFNAPAQTTINLPFGGPDSQQPAEFTWLHSTVTPLLGNLHPQDLAENDTNKDLTYLAGQIGVSRARIAQWAVAGQLSAQHNLPQQLFYALLRRNVPADAQTAALASSSQGVDLAGNAQRLHEAILSTSPAVLQKAVEGAIAAKLIPPSYASQAAGDLAKLGTLANTAALNSPRGLGKTSLASVFNVLTVKPEIQQSFTQLFTTAKGAAQRTFWRDLSKNPAFTAAQVDDLRFGVTVGRLTGGHLPLVTELAAQRRGGTIKRTSDLARLTANDWQALVQKQSNGHPIGIPSNIVASTPALAQAIYANMLERGFSRAYPTVAFSARLAQDAAAPFGARQAVTTFLDANPSFNLLRTNIDAYAKKVTVTPEVRTTLLTAQRLSKLSPSYPAMSALLKDGIHSARQVYFMGRDNFVARYGGNSALGAAEAARIYAKAEQTHSVSLALMLRLNKALALGSPAAVGAKGADLTAALKAFPNLQTLFGSDSFCACQECQSVLGPGAYLVDLLEFLKHRLASGGKSVRDVLLARRPDIAQIELSCPNTNTALPYIDLVNDLLEDAVAPPPDLAKAARARQTTLTTPELNANPRYTNQSAYTTLAGAVYPWILPFDLPLAVARTYLGQLGLDRVQLVKTFQAPAGYPSAQARALAVEVLGFSTVEADIITGGSPAATYRSWDFWGLAQTGNNVVDPYDPTKTVSGAWTDVLAQARVLLSRAGLTYQELARLLNTRFLNKAGSVAVSANPPDSCNVGTMTVTGLTQDVLDRLHRFVRLWRRLGWDVYDLDDAIFILQNAAPEGLPRLNDQLLRQLAVIVTVVERYNMPVREAVTFFLTTPTFGTIPARDVPAIPGDDVRNSLYRDLFLNHTVLARLNINFAPNADGTGIFGSGPLAYHSATLVAALEISHSDLNLAIATFTHDGLIRMNNVSAIYRNVRLARALGVTLTELITLLAIAEAQTDTTPNYEQIVPFDGTRPEALLAFFDAVGIVRDSGLSVAQLDYVLRNVYDASSGWRPTRWPWGHCY